MTEHIIVESVTHRFRTKRVDVVALDDVSLRVARGEFVALIGPSGCGKSTLLRMIADILSPTAGTISIGGSPPRVARREHRIGLVFQDATLLPWRSVIDNIRLPLQIVGGRPVEGALSPEELLELVGLSDFADARPSQLSGGMRQRVSIARALALRPDVLLMDEPFGALDEITRHQLNLELLRIWSETGTTAILVTHSISEAVLMADRVVVLSAGPGRVQETLDIDLERPRSVDQMRTKSFFEAENGVRSALFDSDLKRDEAHR